MTTDREKVVAETIDHLNIWMDETLRLLDRNPELVWLSGYMADHIRYGRVAGGVALATVQAVGAIARELGATDEQIRYILPKDQLKWVMSDEDFKLVRPEEPEEPEEFVYL